MEALPILVFVAFAILALVAGYFASEAAKKRREALFRLAQHLGFEYRMEGTGYVSSSGFMALFSEETDPFLSKFAIFSPFGQGHSQEVKNLMFGRRGDRDWYLFDYSYKTTQHNGKTTTTTTHPYGIVAVRIPMVFPLLSLAAENVFHRIGSKLGMRELTFELEEFNRRYFIQCEEAREAHDILHPKAIDYLMRQPIRHWQFGSTYILFATPGSIQPMEFERQMRELDGFVDTIPDYVKQDRGFAATWQTPLD